MLAAAVCGKSARAASVGGDVTLASTYIFRGLSLSDDWPAGQLDLHVSTGTGTFVGAFASTLHNRHGGTPLELQAYIGQRFNLSPTWSVTFTGVHYAYLNDGQAHSDDYQELSAAVSYLDRFTLSVGGTPNIVRYWMGYRLGRYAAYVTDATAQVPLWGPVLVTAGIGYYSLSGPAGMGYLYGNSGLAYERGRFRVDAGYFFTDSHAERLYPYGLARNRFAASLSWHF